MKRIAPNLIQALVTVSALSLQFTTTFAQGAGFTLLTTITNPIPALSDYFGQCVVAVGDDQVLIGAYGDDVGATDAGVAYLFSTNGVLLRVFTNPAPASGDAFGFSVSEMGKDRVLIGAPNDNTGINGEEAAYLFSVDGKLLTTFMSPGPGSDDFFGCSVAAVGSDRVLIGAYGAGPYDVGKAYLFDTNGTLIIAFTNWTSTGSDLFGRSVTALGNDRVLIGADGYTAYPAAENAGVAYLFSTNGMWLATFANPTPAPNDRFGWSVAAVGSDRVLIGAFGDNMGVGAAYLFSDTGALLTTITNPTPASGDAFGHSVAAIGSDRLLIGAFGKDMGVGAAYLFNTNGALLATFSNLTQTSSLFGLSVAPLGSAGVMIGAPEGDAGAVQLFTAVAQASDKPSLAIRLTTNNTVAIFWPSSSTGWALQENTNGVLSVNWSNAPGPIQDDGTNKTLIVSPPTGNRFYRLFKP